MNYLTDLEKEIAGWPTVTVHPHRFGGKEFRFARAEIGHLHTNGTLDIPFPRPMRDALIEDGQVEEHRWVPNSGWATFHIRSHADLRHAIELMRMSYLRYAAKAAPDPAGFIKNESEALHLDSRLTDLLERCAAR